jgi:hypothetical protein
MEYLLFCVRMNDWSAPYVQLRMARSVKLTCALIVLMSGSTLSLVAQSSPRVLIGRAIALRESAKVLPRYTYFVLDHTQNRTAKGKLFVDETTLYEYTWIGDLPYGRIVETKGKPLKGKALELEQARYDKAVADHEALDTGARARALHHHVVDSNLLLGPLLTPAYTLNELRQETISGNLTHVIDCTPAASPDTSYPQATRHAMLWITDSGAILRQTYELVADETDKLHGSHGQDDFQLIDGTRLPLHGVFHLNAPNGNTGDFEQTYSRFRRFSVSVNLVPASDLPSELPR